MSLGLFRSHARTARRCLNELDEADRAWIVKRLADILTNLTHGRDQSLRRQVHGEAENKIARQLDDFVKSRAPSTLAGKAPLIHSLLQLVSLTARSTTTSIEGTIHQVKRFVGCVALLLASHRA